MDYECSPAPHLWSPPPKPVPPVQIPLLERSYTWLPYFEHSKPEHPGELPQGNTPLLIPHSTSLVVVVIIIVSRHCFSARLGWQDRWEVESRKKQMVRLHTQLLLRRSLLSRLAAGRRKTWCNRVARFILLLLLPLLLRPTHRQDCYCYYGTSLLAR